MKKIIPLFILSVILISFVACKNSKNTAPAEKTKEEQPAIENWITCPSLKETYVDSGIFEHIGFAVPAGNLSISSVQKGIKYQASSVTLENEFKPEAIMRNFANGVTPADLEDFTSSNGITIKVPVQAKLNFSVTDSAFKICKDLGINMRGHVLVWHSQTPKAFFCKDYKPQNGFVSKEEMDARQEWYIKSVLEHVIQWEKENNEGKRIIYTWDVVNEAVSDNATPDNYLRDGSSWYKIYQDDSFVVNAFRYANKYAPEEVLLAYNDYNEFQEPKHTGYLKIIDAIIAAQTDKKLPTRIDIAGMQSHNQTGWPSMAEYEKCIQDFIGRGLDVQITELDITGSWKGGNNFEKPSLAEQKVTYYNYFKLFQKYRKTGPEKGITGVTFWGINDEYSWRSAATPLLFSYNRPKEAFWGVIEAKE